MADRERAQRRVRALACAAALALGACASSDRHCGTGLERPHFGDATRELWGRLVDLPGDVAADWDDRSGRLGDSASRFLARRGDETSLTADHAAGFFPWLGGEFTDRSAQAGDFFARQGDRLADDWCCFPERAWHAIKIAIE